MPTRILIVCVLSLITGSVRAGEGSTAPHRAGSEEDEYTRNALYVEANGFSAGIVTVGSLSLNYERRLVEILALHLGYGGALLEALYGHSIRGHGATAGIKLLFGEEHLLEVGAGASAVFLESHLNVDPEACDEEETEEERNDCLEGPEGLNVYPAVALGYRYQPRQAGVFFRAGLAWAYGYGTPFSIGLGYSF